MLEGFPRSLTELLDGVRLDGVPLDGALRTDEPTRAAASRDAGRYVSRVPRAVLRPGSIADIQRVVAFCRRERIPISARGLANTTDGQGLVDDGVIVDMRSMADISEIGPDFAVVEAGASWLELTRATYPRGLVPPALTGYLALTVGGTLSLGGIPPAYAAGSMLDSVRELEVVTGTGELIRCSADTHHELFEAVLGGLGQFGIIVRATVGLVPSYEKVRGHTLAYDSRATFFDDFRTLIRRGEISEIYGDWWRPGEGGTTARLNAFTFFHADAPPDDERLLRDLSAPVEAAEISENEFLPHVCRIDEAVDQLRDQLDWGSRPKPWFTYWLPETGIESFLDRVLPDLTFKDVGDGGFVLLYVHQRSRLTRPSLRLPAEDGTDWVYLFTVMTAGEPESSPEGGDSFAARMVRRNRRWHEIATEFGGVRYPIESVPFTADDWREHYGDRWSSLTELKQRFDPNSILTPGPGIFT